MVKINVEGGFIIDEDNELDTGSFWDQWPHIRPWLPVLIAIFFTIITIQAIVIIIAMKTLRHKVEKGDKVKTLIVLGSGG